MCAIIGYVAENDDSLETLVRVFEESRIRGLHAFGYSFMEGNFLTTRKFHFWEFGFLLQALRNDKPRKLIGHCRYSTSGDFTEPKNNQPILRGDRALVFNGVLDMGTKEEMEKRHNVNLETENDGEIPLAMFEPLGFLLKTKGSFAGLWFENGALYALRNARRPAWVARGVGATLVASTKDILSRAGLTAASPLEPGKLVAF